MKTSFLLVAVIFTFNLPCRSQVLSIFEQSAEELKEYGHQIAALETLLTHQQRGYHIIESGLFSIGSITGNEFTLHQNYYASLTTVDPAIAQTPESAEFLATKYQILDRLTVALARWRQSQYLTSPDLAYITRMISRIVSMAAQQTSIFNALTSGNNLTMTDDQRVDMIGRLNLQVQSVWGYSQRFSDFVDFVVINRAHK